MPSESPTGGEGNVPGMRHYFHYDSDGCVHVESLLNAERWQHHVHTVPEFLRWCALVPDDSLVVRKPAPCNCDLRPGQVIERNGRIWNFPPFSEQEACTVHE
jgi:hypothetical protein